MPDIDDFQLRPMTSADADTVLIWRNQDHVKANMFSDHDITAAEHKSWFNKTLQQDDVDYQIILFQDKPIGLANAVNINNETKNCHWGFYLGSNNLPRGCGTVLATMMLSHIFETYPINILYGEVFEFNSASLKLHLKFGFKVVPEATRSLSKHGKQENIITLSLDRNVWQNLNQ